MSASDRLEVRRAMMDPNAGASRERRSAAAMPAGDSAFKAGMAGEWPLT